MESIFFPIILADLRSTFLGAVFLWTGAVLAMALADSKVVIILNSGNART